MKSHGNYCKQVVVPCLAIFIAENTYDHQTIIPLSYQRVTCLNFYCMKKFNTGIAILAIVLAAGGAFATRATTTATVVLQSGVTKTIAYSAFNPLLCNGIRPNCATIRQDGVIFELVDSGPYVGL
jgi:hypothetical protein